jgi:hypothetical protein
MSIFPCKHLVQNLKPLKFKYDFLIHQVHPMNIYLLYTKHVFLVQKVWNQFAWFFTFLSITQKMKFKKINIFNLKISKDNYIISKIIYFLI